MSAAKHYLKLTKAAIEKNDPELALEYVEDVLEADADNFFAFIFQGKLYQLLDKPQDAIKSFKKATSLQPDNLLGWKGYYQAAKSLGDYVCYFDTLTTYLQKQIDQGLSLGETLKDASNFLQVKDLKKNPELYEMYLSRVIPGLELYEVVGGYFGKGEDNLEKLIEFTMKKETEMVEKITFKERMRMLRNVTFEQQKALNKLIWPVYSNSSLPKYFEEFLNICNDDEKRIQFQERQFEYKYNVLKCAPEKQQLLTELKQLCEDLVLLKVPSVLAWNVYFDLMDPKSFHDLSLDDIVFCLTHFQAHGLSTLLYGFIHSEISPFDKETILKQVQFKNEPEPEDNDDLLEQVDDDLQSPDTLSEDQVLSFLKEGFAKCSKSVFAVRIIINYYLHLREYYEASDVCKNGIRLLADLQRTLGADLVHSREDIICSLAVVYTYHEAPKNFGRALELYERILETNHLNKRARIGKGLILMEKGELKVAQELLSEVVSGFPNDADALIELGWCQINLGKLEEGREHLKKSLKFITGLDIQSSDLRAKVYWRIAQSYLIEGSDVSVPYDLLIKSLKEFPNFAPSYTSLGLIYADSYDDQTRAQKCFYKAFELDIAEVTSARRLVEEMTRKSEWNVAEVLCTRIIETEKARRALVSLDDKSWPYRVLGCSSLNKHDDAKAIEWFQTALRMAAMDFDCWVGLGEAYYNCGRFEASRKVFERALSIQQDSWQVIYMMGKVLCDTNEFEEGISYLEKASSIKPNEECVLNALFTAKIEQALKLMENGYFGRVLEVNREALDLIKQCAKISTKTQSLWIGLYQVLQVFLKIQKNLETFPISAVAELFGELNYSEFSDPLLKEVTQIDGNIDFDKCYEKFKASKYVECISIISIIAFKVCVHFLADLNRYVRSINYFNLGLAYYEGFNLCGNTDFRSASIKCFKKSIQLEGKNSNFWVALGNAYSSFAPQISQHCLIKAIALESRDGDIWNNLAALYLKYGDVELAQEAFLRSQSVAPQLLRSWLGHALAAQASGEIEKSSNLFKHAFIVSNGRSPLAQLLFALAVLNKRNAGASPTDIETAQEYSMANFAIQNYLKFYPHDKVGLKIALSVSERCKTFDLSKQIGEKLLKILEAEYEESESAVALREFINAKAQIGRVHLAVDDYEQAIEESDMVLGLAEEDDEQNSKNQLSARITKGLAYFFQNKLEQSVEELKVVLGSYSQSEWLITLTTQILNAFGTEDTKQAALDQLFSFIESNEESSLIIVLMLGAISLKDDLVDILPAVKDALNGLSLAQIVSDSRKLVPHLLTEIDQKLGNDSKLWERNAVLFPQDYNVWKNINHQMALKVAQLDDTKLTSYDMSNAFVNSGELRQVQRSLVLAPHNDLAWAKFKQIQ